MTIPCTSITGSPWTPSPPTRACIRPAAVSVQTRLSSIRLPGSHAHGRLFERLLARPPGSSTSTARRSDRRRGPRCLLPILLIQAGPCQSQSHRALQAGGANATVGDHEPRIHEPAARPRDTGFCSTLLGGRRPSRAHPLHRDPPQVACPRASLVQPPPHLPGRPP